MTTNQLKPYAAELKAKFAAAEAARAAEASAWAAEREAGAKARKIAAQIKQLTADLEEAKAAKKAAKARAIALDPITTASAAVYWQFYDEVKGTSIAPKLTPEAREQLVSQLKKMHGET